MTREDILGDLTGIDVENDYRKIPVADIFYDEKFNCRGKPDPMTCQKLADDVELNGLDNAITLQPFTEVDGKKWRIMAGHRRYIALTTWLKWNILPCKINHRQMSEEDALIYNLNENMHREPLTISQEANSIKHLKDKGYTVGEASEKLSLSVGWVQVRFMLLDLSDEIRAYVEESGLTQQQIRDLYTMRKDENQTNKFFRAIKNSKGKCLNNAIKAKVKGKKTKRQRNKTEIIDLQTYIARQLGHGLATRVLAWTHGGITDGDVLDTIKEICRTKGIQYQPPLEDTLQ
jgi:ParB/RepB/Spo0J family partition protein